MPPGLVLHVLPVDAFRGAQAYARQMRDGLDDAALHHRTLTLFRSPPGALRPDASLDVPVGMLRRAGFDPRVAWRLRRAVRARKPAVVVAHGGEPLKYCVAAGVAAGRLVYYKIGTADDRLAGIRLVLHRAALRRAARVAVVSRGAADEAVSLGVPESRVRVVPNGRDPRLYSPAEAVPGAATRLVWIGQLDVTKRPERFLALVGELRAQGYELEARVAGSGPRLEELREPARAAGVELLGSVADVPALLAASDLLVFTGRPPEGLPGVLIEAGMAALPVVTTDVPGARDVVVDGVTGRVVPVDDPGALAGATRELLDDADARARLGHAARARCERELGLDASLGKWRALLDELLQEACTSST